MKRMIALLFAVISFSVLADTWTDPNTGIEWTYTISNGKAIIDGATPCNETITIPSTLGGCQVTSIGSYAFYGCSWLTSVTIPDGVETIGWCAFYGCSGLTSVTIPPSVTSIEAGAFVDCSGIRSITIPSSVTSIGYEAFAWCSGLKSVTILDGVTSIGWDAFWSCSGLTSVTIPSSVISIGESAFGGCSGLMEFVVDPLNKKYSSINGMLCSKDGKTLLSGVNGDVTIPEGVTSVGGSAFEGCSGLTSVTIPSSVTIFENTLIERVVECLPFFDCSGLMKFIVDPLNEKYSSINGMLCSKDGKTLLFGINGDVAIPEGVTFIGEGAFCGYNGLTSVRIPSSTTSIGDAAFFSCSGLTSVTIPPNVTSIGESVFEFCDSLVSITIPSSVTSIGDYTFWGCDKLKTIYVHTGDMDRVKRLIADKVVDVEMLEFVEVMLDGGPYTQVVDGIEWTYTISNGEASLGGGLYNSPAISTSTTGAVTIPSTLGGCQVTSIGDYAFCGCYGLISVILEGVTSIGDNAFRNCSGLTSITIPDGVTSIGYFAFDGCSGLTSVTIPSSVTSIGSNAFSGCYGLISVILEGVTSIGDNAFRNCSGLTSITIPDGVTSIGYFAFDGCSGLTSVTIPSSVTSIGSNAFSGCRGLTSITIPSSVTSIGSNAFSSCSGLTSVTIPEGVTSIGECAFYGCSGITSVTIPSSVTSIGSSAFYGCSGLKSVNISDLAAWCDINFGDYYANPLYYAHNLYLNGVEIKDLVIPDGVTSIGDYAFYSCSTLTAITIPSSVTIIGEQAFFDCSGITSVTIPACITKFSNTFPGAYKKIKNVVICEGVTSIGDSAFSGCSELTSVTIPASVTSIGDRAFCGCSGLESFIVAEDNPSYSSPNGLLCSKDGKTLLYGVCGDVVIPNCVTSIDSYAFYGYGGLTSITIPASVNSIGSYAFSGCDNLTEVTMPSCITKLSNTFPSSYNRITKVVVLEGVTNIADKAFMGCNNLQHLVFPSTMDVSREKFRKWSLTDATIATILNDYIVGDYIVINSTLLGYVGDKDVAELLIPEGIAFIDDEVLAKLFYLERVKLPASLKHIGNGAFSNCTEMISIDFTGELKSVGAATFMNCISFERVVLNDGLVTIGDNAFAASIGSMRLKSVSLPVSLTKIGDGVFDNCDYITGVTVPTHLKTMKDLFPDSYAKIESVVIPEGETTIIDNMFKGCAALKTVTIPNTITTIGDSAFEKCQSIVEIGLPNSVTSLGVAAFSDCIGLKTVCLPSELKEIKDRTFWNCPLLSSLVIPASVKSIGSKIYKGDDETQSLAAVYFLGNAPTVKSDSYEGMPAKAKSYIIKGSLGWYLAGSPTPPPEKWPTCGNAREITYWTPNRFEVTFDGNGGTPETYVAEQITDTTYSLPKENPTRTGYLFEGWWTEPKAGAQIYWNTRVTATKAHTLYAHWKLLADGVTVVFNPNGGTVDPAEADYPAGVTYGNLPVPTRIGHEFLGWYTSPTGGDLITEATEVHKENDELYAHWRPIVYWVVFDANGGNGTMTDQSHTYNVAQTLSKNQYYLNGFKFIGWAETQDGMVKYSDQASVENLAEIQDQRITLYAVWDNASYAVRFDGNGGAGSMENQTFVVEVAQELSECKFTRVGYVFEGWATEPNGIVVYKDKESVKNLSMTNGATVSLYAVWELVKISAPIFNPLDGTVFEDACEVSLVCATEGATIYYRVGAKPKAADKFRYTEPFKITETSEIWAFAQLGNVSSEMVCAVLTKGDLLTIEKAVDAIGIDSFETDEQTGWKPIESDLAKVGATCARSGEISDNQSSRLVAKVNGAGVLSFQWKSSCEEDELQEFDHTEFIVDGVEIARIDGITDWKHVSVELTDIGKSHTVEWVYIKDESEYAGEDCAWLDEVKWERKTAGGAVIADVTALKEVFGAESSVVRNLTSEEELAKFNDFLGKCGITATSQISEKQKQYAYDSFKLSEIMVKPQLFEEEPKLKIDEFKPSKDGWSVSISLAAGDEAIAMAKKALEERIFVGTELTEITAKPTIIARPSEDGTILTFTIVPPSDNKAFMAVRP